MSVRGTCPSKVGREQIGWVAGNPQGLIELVVKSVVGNLR